MTTRNSTTNAPFGLLRLVLLVAVVVSPPARSATYYVSSAGNDSTGNGSQSSPWLTVAHAVSQMSCGDTLNVAANGNFVNGDVVLPSPLTNPNFAYCGETTTIQSSAWAQFEPAGYRTNPANDNSIYGKLKLTSGIVAAAEAHGSNNAFGGDWNCNVLWAADTFTIPPTGGGCATVGIGNGSLVNGAQIEIEINIPGDLFTSGSTLPSELQSAGGPGTKFYVTNCSTSPACGSPGSTFQVSATRGGPAITGSTCTGTCIQATFQLTMPLQVTGGSGTITSPDAISNWTVGTPIVFSACGFQSCPIWSNPENFSMPVPLQMNTVYYIVSMSGRNFSVSSTPGGSPITISSVGVGPLEASNTNAPSNWAFRGLEFTEVAGNTIFGFIAFGGISLSPNGNQLFGSFLDASPLGMVHNIEIDHCYFHALAGDTTPPVRAIEENGVNVYVHDTYISGMMNGESQGVAGSGSPGPSYYANNFIEGAGENVLYGGQQTAAGVPNTNITYAGNYFYKPPFWKITNGTGAPAGSFCWYDTTDPNFAGGEWYQNTSSGQWYQCNASNTWATVTAGPNNFGNPLIKTMTEHKKGQNIKYIGNLYNYNWAAGNTNAAQSGQAWNFSAEDAPAMADDHITAMYNAVYNVYQPWNRGSNCGLGPMVTCTTPGVYPYSIHTTVNNLVVLSPYACGFAASSCAYAPWWTQWTVQSGVTQPSLTFDYQNKNTIFVPDSPSFPHGSPAPWYGNINGPPCTSPLNGMQSATWENSILAGDFLGDCFSEGAEITNYFENSTFTKIAFRGGTSNFYSSVGATNAFTNVLFPSTTSAISFGNGTGNAGFPISAAADYHLSSSSPFSAQNPSASLLSTDGTDLGADIDLVNQATSGTVAGAPPWHLRFSAGSTQAVFRYQAPTTDPCTATIYHSVARIPANQTATGADNSAFSVADVLARELYVSGLQPSTHYWYKVSCGAGVLMVGDFFTVASGTGTYQFSFNWSSPTPMEYSSSPSMSSPTLLPAATLQTVPVAANSVVYVQQGAAGPVTILITP